MISRKKESTSERLQELISEVMILYNYCYFESIRSFKIFVCCVYCHRGYLPACLPNVSQRDALLARQPVGGKAVIRTEDFKKFVAKLRIKSNDYKAKKQEV